MENAYEKYRLMSTILFLITLFLFVVVITINLKFLVKCIALNIYQIIIGILSERGMYHGFNEKAGD